MNTPAHASPDRGGRSRPRLSRSPVDTRSAVVLAVIAGVLALLYAPVFQIFVASWLHYEEYNFALLVPLTSAFLLWRRWDKLRAQPVRPEWRGVVVLSAGLSMLLLGVATGVHVAEGLSFIVVVLGLLMLLWGRGAARVALFPVAYLACGLGLYRGLASSLGFALQGNTARYANTLSNLLGVPSHRDGLLLTVGHTQFLVAETCSGLSSLLALLALGWLLIGEGRGSLLFKVLLFLCIVPLALAANIMRVALVLVISHNINPAVADGFVHTLFGEMIFIITLALLLVARAFIMRIDRIDRAASLPSLRSS